MEESILAWLPEYYEPVVVLVVISICFPLSWYGASHRVFKWLLSGSQLDERQREIYSVMLMRVVGALILGGLPFLAMKFLLGGRASGCGVTLDHLGTSLLGAGIGMLVIGPFFLLVNRYWPVLFTGFPVADVRCWDRKLVVMNTCSWMIYLTGYEFMFRGFMLFYLAEHYGSWPAICIVTAVYTYSHLPEYWSNAAGAFIVGPYLGAMALVTNSLVGPYLLHCFIACSTAILAVKSNPKTHYSPICPD